MPLSTAALLRLCALAAGLTLVCAIPVRAEDSPPGAEPHVQSRGLNLPRINVPPSPPPPSMQPLTVRSTGEGSGRVTFPPANVCPPGCDTRYPQGTPVVLAAVPSPGSTFAGWAGACRGAAPCTVVMDGAKTVEAKFNKISTPAPSMPSQPQQQDRVGRVLQDGRNDGKINPLHPLSKIPKQ